MSVPTRYISIVVLLVIVPVSAWAIAYRPMNNAVHSAAGEIRQRTSKLANYDEINKQYREMKKISATLQKAKHCWIGEVSWGVNTGYKYGCLAN